MPDDDPDAFRAYAQWLYTGKILVRNQIEEQEHFPYHKERQVLVESYLLGEKIQDKAFQDVVIDGLLACIDMPNWDGIQYYPIDLVERVYDATLPGSPLRTLMVDMFVYSGRERWFEKPYENVEFLNDLAKRLILIRLQPSDTSPLKQFGTKCHYHHEGAGKDES